jgi:hypothetical protein
MTTTSGHVSSSDSNNVSNARNSLPRRRPSVSGDRLRSRQVKARAEHLNQSTALTLERLTAILQRGLDRCARLNLDHLHRDDQLPPLDLGSRGTGTSTGVGTVFAPAEPGMLSGLFGGRARHERQVDEARAKFDAARRRYDSDEAARQRWVVEQRARHHAAAHTHQAEVELHNQRIDAIRSGLTNRNRESVESYLELVLGQTPLPPDVPHQAEVAYSP